ncbi:glycerophosphodiester phosphodiesterase [Haloarcula regularis]|uniref:glycerophosphodiester phosphodiesterase n=1 Tax=Haloarcula regularis TaxID=3033392 RepID=UPI0023E8AD5B|nr:glycerophosphodiester phosphodiesterase [Halomicroarcula sp. SYNS111]
MAARPSDVGLNVELKNPGTTAIRPFEALSGQDRVAARERWTPFVERVLSMADECETEVLFSSFCEGALAAVRARRPNARLAALFGRRDWKAGATVARRYDVDALHVPLAQVDHPELVDLTAALGTAVNVWTVRDWQDARRALAAGPTESSTITRTSTATPPVRGSACRTRWRPAHRPVPPFGCGRRGWG